MMRRMLGDYRVFWREFRGSFQTTGALAPSAPPLAAALCRFVGSGSGPKRVLEVGPGTGAVTHKIVRCMGAEDRLDLVELNDRFVARLRERFAHEEPFSSVADRVQIVHESVEALGESHVYDTIVSGLPLNNFSVELVERLLAHLTRLLRPGGTLSFFEYVAVRRARALVSGRAERARLNGIGTALARVLEPYEIRRDCVWPNLPPAWVHHVRLPESGRSLT